MTVKNLIKALESMPENARVFHLWDGAARTQIEHVWVSRSGEVVTADCDEPCHSDKDRPVDAPVEAKVLFWRTPEK